MIRRRSKLASLIVEELRKGLDAERSARAEKEFGVRSANLMRSKGKSVSAWLLEQIMRIAPGRMIEFFIDRSTRRIQHAANAITLKDYATERAAAQQAVRTEQNEHPRAIS